MFSITDATSENIIKGQLKKNPLTLINFIVQKYFNCSKLIKRKQI